MSHTPRIQSVIAEERRSGHGFALRPVASRPRTRSDRQAHLVSEAVVADYIHEISGRRRAARRARRPGA